MMFCVRRTLVTKQLRNSKCPKIRIVAQLSSAQYAARCISMLSFSCTGGIQAVIIEVSTEQQWQLSLGGINCNKQ